MESIKTTLNLPTNLFKEAKLAAIHQNITFTEIVIRGLEKTLRPESDAKKSMSLSQFLKNMTPLPQLTDQERQARYQKHFEEKYG